MKILVTGAAGFIGSHMTEKLIESGHEVIGLDNYSPYYPREHKEANVREIVEKGVRFAEVDLVEHPLDEHMEGVDVVVHMAAQPGISEHVPLSDYVRNNLLATAKLLEAAGKNPNLKLFINVSTSSVYGKHAVGDESVAPAPASNYGVTKLAAEQLALSYFHEKAMPVCSVRPFSVYGERERPDKLFSRLIQSLHYEQPFPLYEGSESHKRSYTHVGDIVEGIYACIMNPQAVIGEIINLGTEDVTTTSEAIKAVEKAAGKKVIIERKPRRAGDQMETRARIDKAKKLIGYNPRISIAEGVFRHLNWFRKKVGAPATRPVKKPVKATKSTKKAAKTSKKKAAR